MYFSNLLGLNFNTLQFQNCLFPSKIGLNYFKKEYALECYILFRFSLNSANILSNEVGFGNAQPRNCYLDDSRNFYASMNLNYQYLQTLIF